MNRFAFTKSLKNHDPFCGDLMAMAERELASFFAAVTELFGSEQAQVAADNWLHELMAANVLPSSTRQWRLFTAKVMAKLPPRLNISLEALATR